MAKLSKNEKRHIGYGYVFISLWLVGFLVFALYPIAYSLFLSMNSVNISATGIDATYIAVENYSSLFTLDMAFLQNFIRYYKEVMVSVPLVIILSLVIALLLNSGIRGQSVFRAIYFLPVIIISGPILEIFDSNNVFNGMITMSLDMEMLSGGILNVVAFLVTNIVEILWYTGVPILIFIVGLQKIPRDMYEASFIDGASPWQSFWKLTLPSLVGYIVINIIFTVVQISTMDNQPIIKLINDKMFDIKYGFGYASATAWVYFLMIITVILFYLGIVALFNRKEKR